MLWPGNKAGILPPVTEGAHIRFRDVHVEYPGHVRGLNGIKLDIAKGEMVFLLGRTGAGKSTLLKLLTGEAHATQGSVELLGEDLSRYHPHNVHILRRKMGIVPQDTALIESKRVWENVAYALRSVGVPRTDARRRIPEVLDLVRMTHRADAFPNQLSGGERQRVAIARALIHKPPLILADEPTGQLDPAHSLEIADLLRALNLRGATVVVASHDMSIVEHTGARAITVEGGKIVSDREAAPL
ncbi:ATP-binding cassette domain-containing protein [bacterium]|nr:MAG: ATP-binding cassette domain-containing protein [bacterium]